MRTSLPPPNMMYTLIAMRAAAAMMSRFFRSIADTPCCCHWSVTRAHWWRWNVLAMCRFGNPGPSAQMQELILEHLLGNDDPCCQTRVRTWSGWDSSPHTYLEPFGPPFSNAGSVVIGQSLVHDHE